MIYYYKHKSIADYSREEIDMLGYDGAYQFAVENGLDPDEVFQNLKQLETDITNLNAAPYTTDDASFKALFDKAIDEYIYYFNSNAKYDRQAYIVIGNAASGKSYISDRVGEATHSMIIDSDNIKMGERTEKGFYEGLSSLYIPLERDRVQKPCGDATKQIIDTASNQGMNLILTKASKSIDKLERQLQILEDRNYDIHLIMVDSPAHICARRNYYRYLVKEYRRQTYPTGQIERGRFVPVSVVKGYSDPIFDTFVNAYRKKRYKSYTALYGSEQEKEPIDLNTMILDY